MPPLDQIRVLPFNNEEIGMGFNTESIEAVGTAFEPVQTFENIDAPGDSVGSQVTFVTTHEELMDKLGFSFEGGGRYGFFSGGLKTKYTEQTNFNTTSTFLLAQVNVDSGMKRGRGFTVRGEAQDLLRQNRFDEFRQAFGDFFVRGIQRGGEFYAVMRVTSTEQSIQTTLAGEAQASFSSGLAAASFKASLETAKTATKGRTEFSAMMFQRGGQGTEIAPTSSIDEILARYKAFPQAVVNSPAGYGTELASYDTVPLPIRPIEERESFLLALGDARSHKLRYMQLRNDVDFAILNPSFFVDLPSFVDLQAAKGAYTALSNAAMTHARKLLRGEVEPALFDPTTLVPPLREPPLIAFVKSPIVLAPRPRPAPLVIKMTLPGIIVAGGWRTAEQVVGLSDDDMRNLVIVELSARTLIPPLEPFFLQRFTTIELIGKAAAYIFSLRAQFRSEADLRTMTTDDIRNMVIVENDARVQLGAPRLQAMTDQELVNLGLGWFNN